MLWAVWCEDGVDVAEERARRAREHSRHLDAATVRLVIAGPLTSDDGTRRRGSLFVFEAASRREVESQMGSDPFFTRGVWRSIVVSAFTLSRNKGADSVA